MKMEEKVIKIYDKRERITIDATVVQLSDNHFRMVENSLCIDRLVYGTEFECRLNKDGCYEIVRITKESKFVTTRFSLTGKFKESEYRILGDEITKHGGFWQVDFGSMAVVNLPKGSDLNLNEI